MQTGTILKYYSTYKLARVLGITPTEAKLLKTDPSATLSMENFEKLCPSLPKILTSTEQAKLAKRTRRPNSLHRLPKSIDSLRFVVKSPPVGERYLTNIKVHFMKRSQEFVVEARFMDPDMILNDIFEQVKEASLKTAPCFQELTEVENVPEDLKSFVKPVITKESLEEAEKRARKIKAQKMRLDVKNLFGEEWVLFENLALLENRTMEEIYGKRPVVAANYLEYGGIDNTFIESFFPYANTVYRTKNPFTIQSIFEKLCKNCILKAVSNKVFICFSDGGLTTIGVIVIETDGTAVYYYPVDDRNQHVLWRTPYIELFVRPTLDIERRFEKLESKEKQVQHGIHKFVDEEGKERKTRKVIRIEQDEISIKEQMEFLTDSIKVYLTRDTKLKLVDNFLILGNGKYCKVGTTQEELTDLIKNPNMNRRKYPDFSKYKGNELWTL